MNQIQSKVQIVPIVLFYIVACAIAWPIFLNMPYFQELFKPVGIPFINPYLIIMWGPGIAAVVIYLIYGKKLKRNFSLFGRHLKYSLLFFFIPWLISMLINLIAPVSENFSPAKMLVLIPVSFVFTLGEELGWRGFLQDALNGIPRFLRWGIVAVMWEIWHIRFMWIDESLKIGIMKTAVFFIGTLILAVVLGELQQKTKSLLIPITVHIWANSLLQTPSWQTSVTLGISLIFWFFIIRAWEGRKIETLDA